MQAKDDLEDFRAQCRRNLARSLEQRMRYGFCYTYKPVLDDARWRSFDSTAEYRAWCRKNLPTYLGYGELDALDFVQIKSGPFDIDLVFAPDGIEDYDQAKGRMDRTSGLPVLNIRDIIASKRAAARPKDAVELPLLEAFREEYEKHRQNRG